MNPVPFAAYLDRVTVAPGESIDLHTGGTPEIATGRIVRISHPDETPYGPPGRITPVPGTEFATQIGHGIIAIGSHAYCPLNATQIESIDVDLWIFPTTPTLDRHQTIAHLTLEDANGIDVGLDTPGHLNLSISKVRITSSQPVRSHVWSHVRAHIRTGDNIELRLDVNGTSTTASGGARQPCALSGISFAAAVPNGAAHSHYNGKIDRPTLTVNTAAGSTTTLAWDFHPHATNPTTPLTIVNRPTTAVTGHQWDGTRLCWTDQPDHYSAAHFHDDDLDNANWPVTATLTVPNDLATGVYGVQLDADDHSDVTPFFVTSNQPRSRIAVWLPTFTYLAYANDQQLSKPAIRAVFEELGASFDYPSNPTDAYIAHHNLKSTYDTHSDESGVAYASWKRPLLSWRPDYKFPFLQQGTGASAHLQADLHLLDWLEHHHHDVDIITDEILHTHGAPAINDYAVVITGTHNEYVTHNELAALEAYSASGGRLMYLSGNGLYWVTAYDGDSTIEIRRAGPSTRTWDAQPGEHYLSFTGEPGGTWRNRQRAPQRLVNVGFTAEGLGSGSAYLRQRGSTRNIDWVFDRIDTDLIGDFESLVCSHGAAGWELDRYDTDLGSDPYAAVLATASDFGPDYQHCCEEVFHSDSAQGAPINERVRADLTLAPDTPRRGAVFSTGSIAWCGQLSHNDYDNSTSQLTANILNRFLDPTPIRLAKDHEV